MKKVFIVLILVLGAAVGVAMYRSSGRQTSTKNRNSSSKSTPAIAQPTPRIPAHHKDPASARPLKATLDPELFFGKTRQAYQVAREIPETLAQLPCYCYCDQGHGHKSLYTCYEDDHSAHCSTCVDEALMAYRLEKEQKLSPSQIRERIIQEFSK